VGVPSDGAGLGLALPGLTPLQSRGSGSAATGRDPGGVRLANSWRKARMEASRRLAGWESIGDSDWNGDGG